MTFPSSFPVPMKLYILAFILLFSCFRVTSSIHRDYTSIFSFGDSLADTGNSILTGAVKTPSISRLPYGMTYFGHPTGRCSDGRLVVDFIAEALGLPYLPPYLAHSRNIRQGVNFAVAGATALDPAFFEERGFGNTLWTNLSLSAQLRWFEELKPSLCTSPQDCSGYFGKSLFLVGEIGGNDYNYAFSMGKSVEEVTSYVPNVVEAITKATERLINHGARVLVVPGNLPIGCSPAYLTVFYSSNREDYDPRNGCLKLLNKFASYHNSVLRLAMERLQRNYPQARIIYADYYHAAIRIAHSPKHFGFKDGVLRACCGGGGPYNFNISAGCGNPGSRACSNPSSYVNWDGVHLTEAAYRTIATALLQGPYANPPILVYRLS